MPNPIRALLALACLLLFAGCNTLAPSGDATPPDTEVYGGIGG